MSERRGEKGFVVILTVLIMGALMIGVMMFVSRYVGAIGREHGLLRNALLLDDVAESFGVALRRGYDVGRRYPTCRTVDPAGQPAVLGQPVALDVGQGAPATFCLPDATKLCVAHPLRNDPSHKVEFCAEFAGAHGTTARAENAPAELVARAGAGDWPTTSRRPARWLQRLAGGLGDLGVPAAGAAKSDILRPQPPPPGTTVINLPGPGPACDGNPANCRMFCGSLPCLRIRVCDPETKCTDESDFFHQRFAFPSPT